MAFKYNGKIVNELSIEQYNTETQQWEPLTNSGDRAIHRPSYFFNKRYFDFAATVHTYTMPEDGFLTAQAFASRLTEFETSITLIIKDTNNNIVTSSIRNSAIIGLRPETTMLDVIIGHEVKKGYTITLVTAGISSGILNMFWKLDCTYKMVDKKGNPL